MSRRTVLGVLVAGLIFGGLTAIFTGDEQAVSIRLWLGCVILWFATASVRRLFAGIPLVPSRLSVPFAGRWRKPLVPNMRGRQLRALEALLLRSRDNDRAFTQQLQPRIVALADHFLPVTHGIDRHAQPERAQALLGDLAWMLNPTDHRAPTLQEIDDLVHRLTNSAEPQTPTTPTKEAA